MSFLAKINYHIMELLHGEHRSAAKAVQGDPAQGPHQSAGWSGSHQTLYDSYAAGKISAAQLSAAWDALDKATGVNVLLSAKTSGLLPLPYTNPQAISAYAVMVQNTHAAMQQGYSQTRAALNQQLAAQAQYGVLGFRAGASGVSNPHNPQSVLAQANAFRGIYGGVPAPPHEPTTLKSESILAGEIIAWRAWFIVVDNLFSVVATDKFWRADEPMQGDPAAGYGVHAYKSPHGPLLDGYVAAGHMNKWVIGEVALWGDVIEHEDGYRSEFAKVHSLVTWSDHVSKDDRKKITDRYLGAQNERPGLGLESR